jgi:Protein of unknown function (DUF4239)
VRWVVVDVPTWVVGVVVIVGLVVLALLAKVLIVRKAKWLLTDSHNEVAGFLVAIVAVVYAVIVGFTIVSLYEASVTANDDVSTEAANLLRLHDGNFVLGPTVADQINADVAGYAAAVVHDWRLISSGEASPRVQKEYDDLYSALSSDNPKTPVQADYLRQAITDVGQVGQARDARILEARESGSLPLVLWIGILLTSAVTLGFALVFSLENLRVAFVMVAGVAAVLGVNLFVLVELGYPFLGSVAVGPGRFETVIRLVGGA